jgi:hypothetical protein
MTKRIYSNVDTKLVTDTDEIVGEGFESDEAMVQPRFRRWKGRMEVDAEQLRNSSDEDDEDETEEAKTGAKDERKERVKGDNNEPVKEAKSTPKPAAEAPAKQIMPKPQKVESPISSIENKPVATPIGHQDISTTGVMMNSGLKRDAQ